MDASAIPVVIICRDRLRSLVKLVEWCEMAGHTEIVLLDNASTYPLLLDYFEASKHEVVRLGRNSGPQAAWKSGLVRQRWRRRWYIVTDPDVVPAEECPLDVVRFMHDVMQRHTDVLKVGLGLKTDDLPLHYPNAEAARTIEGEFYLPERLVEPRVYRSPVDTTYALYRPGRRFDIQSALRLSPPFMARHLPWYEDPTCLSDDEAWYQAHAEKWNNWHTGELSGWLSSNVERVKRGEPEDVPRPTATSRVKRLLRR